MVPLLALCGLAAISSSPALPVAATGKTLRHRYVSIELGAGQCDRPRHEIRHEGRRQDGAPLPAGAAFAAAAAADAVGGGKAT